MNEDQSTNSQPVDWENVTTQKGKDYSLLTMMLAVVITIIIAGFVFVLWQTRNSETGLPQTELVGWNQYKNESEGIELKYPRDYVSQQIPEFNSPWYVTTFLPINDEFVPGVKLPSHSLTIHRLHDGPVSVDDFEQFLIHNTVFDGSGLNPESIADFDKRTIGNLDYYFIEAGRFEGHLILKYYVSTDYGVYSFESQSVGVDWTNPNLDVENDEGHLVTKQILQTVSFSEAKEAEIVNLQNTTERPISSEFIDEKNDGLVLLYPNSEESFVVGFSSLQEPFIIMWTPNDGREVNLYLEKYDPKTGYKIIGRLYPDQNVVENNSIKWLGGVNQMDIFPDPGLYYIKIEESTGRWDRSDKPIQLLPEGYAEMRLLINGKRNVFIDNQGGVVSLEWESEKTTDCELAYFNKTWISEPVPSSGQKKIFVEFSDFILSDSVQFGCKIDGAQSKLYAWAGYKSSWTQGEYISVKKNYSGAESYARDGETVTLSYVIDTNVRLDSLERAGLEVDHIEWLKPFEEIRLYVDGQFVGITSPDYFEYNLKDEYYKYVFALIDDKPVPVTSGSVVTFEFKVREDASVLYRSKEIVLRGVILKGFLDSGMVFRSLMDQDHTIHIR